MTAKISDDPKRCRRMCTGGYQCTCRSDIRHMLHVCSNPRCICHARERYELETTDAPAQAQPAQVAEQA